MISIKQPLQIMVFYNMEKCSQVNGKWKEQDMQMYNEYDCNYGNRYLNFEPEHSNGQSFYPSQSPLWNSLGLPLCLVKPLSGSRLNVIFSWKHLLFLRVPSDQLCPPVVCSHNFLILLHFTYNDYNSSPHGIFWMSVFLIVLWASFEQ